MPTLLIVDDEPNLLYSVKKVLQSDSLHVITAETAAEGIEQVRVRKPDAVILDVRLPDMSGLDAFVAIHELDRCLPVIIITAFSTTDTAIEAMKRGAFEYLLKPMEFDSLRDVVARALESRRTSGAADGPEEEEGEPARSDAIIGCSPAMQEVYKAIGRVASQDVTVLILGKSGTGKEMVARAVHHHSRRRAKPYLAINCAAIPEALLESELFGHERGAFTGADRQRIGKFEQLDGGTLFLDEVGDMSPATQAKVLRLLQDGSFERVGGSQTRRADVRLIAATNRDLETMVQEGTFRRDLYYRLRVFAIELPTLRERPEDLPRLVDHFLRIFNRDFGKRVRTVAPQVMRRLEQHDWPGNVRELQSVLKYALLHAVGDAITPSCLPESFRRDRPGGFPPPEAPEEAALADFVRFAREMLQRDETDVYRKTHAAVDRVLLEQVLNHVEGNQVQAAQILGVSRSTLRTRINDLGLTIAKRVSSEPARDG